MKEEFKIVKIIDKYSVIINGGKDDIEVGDLFEIYLKGAVDVMDIDTKESLGSYDFVKAIIVANKVEEKMTKCINHKKTGGFAASFDVLYPKIAELNIDYDAMTDDFNEVDRIIRIGDTVRLVNRNIT